MYGLSGGPCLGLPAVLPAEEPPGRPAPCSGGWGGKRASGVARLTLGSAGARRAVLAQTRLRGRRCPELQEAPPLERAFPPLEGLCQDFGWVFALADFLGTGCCGALRAFWAWASTFMPPLVWFSKKQSLALQRAAAVQGAVWRAPLLHCISPTGPGPTAAQVNSGDSVARIWCPGLKGFGGLDGPCLCSSALYSGDGRRVSSSGFAAVRPMPRFFFATKEPPGSKTKTLLARTNLSYAVKNLLFFTGYGLLHRGTQNEKCHKPRGGNPKATSQAHVGYLPSLALIAHCAYYKQYNSRRCIRS